MSDNGPAPTANAVLDHVVRGLVDEPDAVRIDTEQRGRRTILEVHVAPGELGRVIGRRGRTAQSIRTVVRPPPAATASRSTSTSSIEPCRSARAARASGRIGKRPLGCKGEVVVDLVTDYPEVRLAPGSRLWTGDAGARRALVAAPPAALAGAGSRASTTGPERSGWPAGP